MPVRLPEIFGGMHWPILLSAAKYGMLLHVEAAEDSGQLLGPAQIRQLAAELDVTPTKKLGQNFLHDPNTVRMIVQAAAISPDDHVIEVGPGLGSLTLGLLPAVHQVTAVEIDARLAQQLPHTVAQYAPQYAQRLQLLHRNALHLQATGIAQPTAVVANLPYNVAVPVLLHLLELYPTIRRVLVMVQAEVADRLAAAPGSKVYGVPSVKANFFGQVRRAGTIGKKVFWPAPNIDSGLVRIDCYPSATEPWARTEQLRRATFQLIDAAFAQRRKTIRAALRASALDCDIDALLAAAAIEPTVRGESLGIADYVRMATIGLEQEEQ